MAKKNVIRTLQGKALNMDELALRNEKVRPVGNLNKAKPHKPDVNDTVATGTRRPSKDGRRQNAKIAQDAPVMNSIKAAKIIAKRYLEEVQDDLPAAVTVAEEPAKVKGPSGPAPKPVAKTVAPTPATVKPAAPAPAVTTPEPAAPKPADEVSMETLSKVVAEATAKKPGGLASAIAKAREVKQEPLKTPREEARSETGVKKF